MTGLDTFIAKLHRLTEPAAAQYSDVEMLRRYVEAGDAAAFEVLVWRHGAMVHNVCRRMLRSEADAEDAFQAAFVLLARKGHTIGRRGAVGSWLYRVAVRVAIRAQTRRARREQPLDPACESRQPDPRAEVNRRELGGILDEEIHALPTRYRSAFVLCHLQGRTRDEAARELGCPRGTVDSRLAWAMARLRQRLLHRGVGPTACGFALTLLADTTAAPPAWVSAAVQLAVPGSVSVPAGVAQLSMEVLGTMFWKKCQLAAAIFIAVSLLGAIGWQSATTANPPDVVKPTPMNAGPNVADAGWRLLFDLPGPAKDLYGLAFSPDGKLLAAAGKPAFGEANAVALFDAGSGKEVRRFLANGAVTHLTFSPDGRRIATTQNDGVYFHEATTGQIILRLEFKGSEPDRVAFSGDRMLASLRDGSIFAFDAVTGRTVWNAGRALPAHHFALSPDGKTIAVGGDNAITLLHAATGRGLRRILNGGGKTQWVAFAPDGNRLAAATNGEVHLFDIDSGIRHEFPNLKCVIRNPWLTLVFSPDGKTLACANSDAWSIHSHQVTMIDLATGTIAAALTGHSDRVWSLAFSPDGRLLASADAAGRIKIWERVDRPAQTGTPKPRLVAGRLDQLVSNLLKSNRTDAQIVEALFLATLGRLPTEAEQQRSVTQLAASGNRSTGFARVLLELTNSAEHGTHLDDLRRHGSRRGN